MKKKMIVESLRSIIISKVNTLDIDELRATYFALLPVTADPELKDLLFGEPEPDDVIKEQLPKEQLPAPKAIQKEVPKSVSKAVKEDLPAGTFAAEDELPTGEFTGGDEIGDDHPDEGYPDEPNEDTLLEKIPHYNDTAPAKKPELPQGTTSGECWVITRSYGFIPDGPGYDITGDELIYGIYDSWEPAIKEFRNISERTDKTIEEGKDFYKISCWNPKTGTAGYTLKKHGVNGNHSDEDEFTELFYYAAAETSALGMAAFTEGKLPELANEISGLSSDINANVAVAKKIFGDELPSTIKTAVDTAEEVLRQLIALMAKLAE